MSQIDDQDLKEEFYKLIDYYSNVDPTVVPKELNTESEVKYYKSVIQKIVDRAKFLKNFFHLIPLEYEQNENFIRYCLPAASAISFNGCCRLEVMHRIKIPDFKRNEFKPLNVNEEALARPALKSYVEVAKVIRSTNYENSIADNIERIIQGDFDLLRSIVGLDPNDTTYDLSKAFVTLAAPSLDGKTQFAFVLEKIRPLYFTVGADRESFGPRRTQAIYLNFENLNKCLREHAKEDVKLITQNSQEELNQRICEVPRARKHGRDREALRLTVDELKNHQNNLKLSALGLLVHLVNDAKDNYDTLNSEDRPSWLEYHANRQDANFLAKSIDEIPHDFFKGYCLFLDEYRGRFWEIYVRNLAQVIGLRCVICNNNNQIANFIGIDNEKDKSIWSIVVNELKMGSYEKLNSLTGIDENINWICENAISDQFKDDKRLCCEFFDNFKEKQIHELRPGVAYAFANAIIKYKSDHQDKKSTFDALLCYLINRITYNLYQHKPKFEHTSQGAQTNLLLFNPNAYNRLYPNLNRSSHIQNLNNHFFYLINPVDPMKWIFLTVAPTLSEYGFCDAFISNKDDPSFPLEYINEKDLKPVPWKLQSTYFRSEEILTILACMNMSSVNKTFDNILRPFVIGESNNIFDDSQEKKAELLYLALVCITGSSHRKTQEQLNTLSGQSGQNFLLNFMVNSLKYFENNRLAISTELKYPESAKFNIQDYLERITIPFLYVSVKELPELFKSMNTNSAIGDKSINFGKIDFKDEEPHFDLEFPYYYRNSDSKFSSFTCVADWKNWEKDLKYNDLIQMAKYACKTSQTLCIAICKTLGKPINQTAGTFNRYCSKHHINAYKLNLCEKIKNEDEDKRVYKVTQLNDNSSANPKMIFLVLSINEKEDEST